MGPTSQQIPISLRVVRVCQRAPSSYMMRIKMGRPGSLNPLYNGPEWNTRDPLVRSLLIAICSLNLLQRDMNFEIKLYS